jgi:hypothetical protein
MNQQRFESKHKKYMRKKTKEVRSKNVGEEGLGPKNERRGII